MVHRPLPFCLGLWKTLSIVIISLSSFGPGDVLVSGKPKSDAVNYCYINDGHTWIKFNSSCYFFDTKTKRSWYWARQECSFLHSDLVSVTSEAENTFLYDLSNDGPDERFWTSLVEVSQGIYRWTDKSALIYDNFRPGQPDDHFGEEKCVIFATKDGRWNDEHCSMRFLSICKRPVEGLIPATEPPLIVGKCPHGFLSEAFSNKCYRLDGLQTPKTWIDAHKACRAINNDAELASIVSTIDQIFLVLMLEESQENVWIGMNSRPQGFWVWVDNSDGHYSDFVPYNAFHDKNKQCAQMLGHADKPLLLGKWEARSCDEKKPFICQAPREESSEKSPNPFKGQYRREECGGPSNIYFRYHKRCYRLYDHARTWEDAKKVCKQDKSQLALTENMYEVARLTYEIFAKDDRHTQFWIGVRFNKDLGEYVWNDKYKVNETYWSTYEPDDQSDDSCVSVDGGFWADEKCNKELPFFCVLEDYKDFVPKPPRASEARCANPDHTHHGDRCYLIPHDKKAVWSEANRQCNRMNMTLVSIHDMDTVTFLTSLLKKFAHSYAEAWIGLERGVDGEYRWTDGSPENFFVWDKAQPSFFNEFNQSEECVHMAVRNGRWNDLSCAVELAYICMTETVGDPSGNTSDGLSGALVAGILVGVLIVVVLLVGVGYALLRKRQDMWKLKNMLWGKRAESVVGFSNNRGDI